ncbi:MAG: radical SAM protein [Marinilabiliales bacterium]|nr:MAG: radical SAM protein [Marinilabiliales bacterium]
MMELSRFNIISAINDSDEFFVLNPLYGSADILSRLEHDLLVRAEDPSGVFAGRGYLVDRKTEKTLFTEAYLKFLDDRETDEIQLFFVPAYTCNFDCSYCYQIGYDSPSGEDYRKVIDAFFRYSDSEFAGRRKYITLFGGEPLLPGKRHRETIEYFIDRSTERGTDIAVVTNGFHVDEYLNVFRRAQIREIQVTLDGTREVHDSRRRLRNGEGTFDRIVRNVDMLLENNIPVNLRMVVDRENIGNLPDLARFAINRGWTSSGIFSTQLGRNYELHECQLKRNRLFSRIDLHSELYRIIRDHPHVLDFHRPAFSVSRALHENGKLPAPLFDACPGTKTEWAFDYTGKIYACTATVGKPGEELGSFFPERVIDMEKVEEWSERDILSVEKCRECEAALICGGGCAAVAKNKGGSLHGPDCRPVKELLELGISAYFDKAGS